MNDDRPVRPLDRDDYERAYIVLSALKLKAVLGEDRPLWGILRDFHQDRAPGGSRVGPDDLVGDEAASAEVTHALIVLELLAGGTTMIHDRPTLASQTVCRVPGCPNTTTTALCWQHELDAST